jgi:hypothetical protein
MDREKAALSNPRALPVVDTLRKSLADATRQGDGSLGPDHGCELADVQSRASLRCRIALPGGRCFSAAWREYGGG